MNNIHFIIEDCIPIEIDKTNSRERKPTKNNIYYQQTPINLNKTFFNWLEIVTTTDIFNLVLTKHDFSDTTIDRSGLIYFGAFTSKKTTPFTTL